MGVDKKELVDVLNASVKDLQKGIDMHCCLITSIVEERLNENNLQPILDRCPKRSRELRLEKAITDAIDVLEESRKAFKSKKLEGLRKQLTHVLIDVE
ncbi:hypothetical protein DSCA_39560 [Desulfosarcina alkanivorans]|jgi:uncharacterized protein (UPF0332 family)|uniref:Uncharacterized protein n=1 Tax=Desulfosarcina alkanivorans TaxID=571177 RepID=A0A5K7YLD3_9BACT|nr:hypothetical protein [Desulfosarcina alkanivorans]BBO70026.1 hypothetical protein DSCA_39560 [Desulfosarcina alkanivorans]